ncbi:MAG TPA: DUF5996 family protein [Nannocystaceae bacterium]|nr:DUF5996 family protein [Nannocystaceae bacterium]
MAHSDWPALALADWEDTYLTLHRWTQIVGKLRMRNAAWLNHWWHTTLVVTPRGLATTTTPCNGRELGITFDFCSHELVVQSSDKRTETLALAPMSVAEFYGRTIELFRRLGADVDIWPVPVEVVDRTPFPDDTKHASYDRRHVEALHRILLSVDRVFNAHRGRFLGKSSPSHFFWGAFDLAVTRFSGRRNPQPPADAVMGEAYSHEVISHGFWPGGDWPTGGRVEDAVFYAYESPAPAGLGDATIRPPQATWSAKFGEFMLPYEDVRRASDPAAMLLDFMESTYVAAAELAQWDVDDLQHARFATASRAP